MNEVVLGTSEAITRNVTHEDDNKNSSDRLAVDHF
jgi:hypothetical protein